MEKRQQIWNGWLSYFGSTAPAAFLKTFRRLFAGRPDAFAHYECNGSSGGDYTPVRAPLTDAALASHLSGEAIIGAYLSDQDSHTRSLVLDVDGPAMTDEARQKALCFALALRRALQSLHVFPLLFDSGGKGAHLWICLDRSIKTDVARNWADEFLNGFRPFPLGVMVEVFPRQDITAPNAPGSLIRLPLGRHPKTGRMSRLLDEAGCEIGQPSPVLESYTPTPAELIEYAVDADGADTPTPVGPAPSLPEQNGERIPRSLLRGLASGLPNNSNSLLSKIPRSLLRGSLQSPPGPHPARPFHPSPSPTPPPSIKPLIDGCTYIRQLVDKAAQTGHLAHTERLTLLYTLGHAGDAGRACIHQVVSLCDDYSPRVTERWIRRLEAGHPAIKCSTVKEWLKDYLPGVSCACHPGRKNGSPVDWLKPPKQAEIARMNTPSPAVTNTPDTVWEAMADDLFSFGEKEDG